MLMQIRVESIHQGYRLFNVLTMFSYECSMVESVKKKSRDFLCGRVSTGRADGGLS
jgi:hypothetical protein